MNVNRDVALKVGQAVQRASDSAGSITRSQVGLGHQPADKIHLPTEGGPNRVNREA
jgi:hypothetical protein